jgi:exonuclease SbcD
MSRTLIVGDIHLGKGLSIGKPGIGSALNSRVVDQAKLLDWILSIAVDKQVTEIILTGDIFENVNPDFQLMKIFIDWLKKIELENIFCHIIVGNHDIKRTGSIYTSALDIISAFEFDKIFVYKNITTIETFDTCFTFVPFRDRRSLNVDNISDAISYINECLEYEVLCMSPFKNRVLVGHLTLDGSIYVGDEIDDYQNEIICPLSMFKNYHYVWMGHIHKPQIRNERSINQPHIAHIGSLDLSDFGETDHIKNLILYDSSLENKFETINVPSRPLRRLRINIAENTDTTNIVIDNIKQNNEFNSYLNAIVKLEITINGTETPQLDKKKVEEYIYSLGAYYISNISESRNISVISTKERELFNDAIDVKSAVKLFAEKTDFITDDEKSEFINECYLIIDEIKE